MHHEKEKLIKVRPVFLLGSNPSFIREDGLGFHEVKDKSEQDTKTDGILHQLGIDMEPKILVRKEEDFYRLDMERDAFIIFIHCMERFPSIISLANTGIPIILAGEEGALGDTLDTFEYIADFDNVKVAFNFEEIRQRIRILKAVKHIIRTTICVFDLKERPLNESGWYKNPLLRGKLKTQYIDVHKFENRYKSIDKEKAEKLAKKWMKESKVIEPSLEDVTKSASLYIAMKGVIKDMNTNTAYVLWCGQFTKLLGTKMCFAIAKLNDDGYLTGCWRGENLLPMLILHGLSEKPIFFGEIHMYRDGVISLRHCAVPQKIASCHYVLRSWRNMKGTVTPYCELPKGKVTLVNSGIGDRMVVMKGEVIDCRDLGGDNCRTTVWVKIDDKELVYKITGREFAMVYGDYSKEAKEVGNMLGIKRI